MALTKFQEQIISEIEDNIQKQQQLVLILKNDMEIPIEKYGVHATHCYIDYGCKYGDDEKCPVVKLKVRQAYLCEDCEVESIEELYASKNLVYTDYPPHHIFKK